MEKACMLQLKRESLKKLELKFCGYSECESLHSFGPASILEMENKNGIILVQAPVAITLLLIHIILMYILAF